MMDFKYDVFISYSHKDKGWVVGTLLPALEKAGLKVCIDFRDFMPGKPARHNMRDRCKESAYTVLVMSPAWVKSEWTSFESLLSLSHDPAGQHRRTIPILFKACDIPEDIKIITYVDFLSKDGETHAWKNLFKALGKPIRKILHNLPSGNELIGRKEEKSRAHESLLAGHPNMVSIDGIGGIGKTALALQIAHECLHASEFIKTSARSSQTATFDGFIWTTAKDYGLALDDILDEIARTLGHDIVMKQPLEEKQRSIHKILQDNRCLLIVDSYEAITDDKTHAFLSHIPETSKVLITTREQNIGEAWVVSLKGLPKEDALELIRTHADVIALTAIKETRDDVLLRLWEATGGHPLATKWALGQIKQRGQSLDIVLSSIEHAEGNIFDSIFSASWNLLSSDAQQILRIMPFFVNDTFRKAIESASGIHGNKFTEALAQLVEMSLVVNVTDNILGQRYGIHPLTRAFANKNLEIEPQVARNAGENLAAFFEEYTKENGGLWNLAGSEKLKHDVSNIVSIIRWCWKEKQDKEKQNIELGVSVFDNIRYFIVNYGFWNMALELAYEAIKLFPLHNNILPDQLTDWQTKIVVFRVWPIAWIYRFRGHYQEAKEEIYRALAIFEHIDHKPNIAMAKRHLGLVLQKTGEYENAERFLRGSLELEEFLKQEEILKLEERLKQDLDSREEISKLEEMLKKAREDKYRINLLNADLADLSLQKGNLEEAWDLSKIVLEPSHGIKDSQCIARFYKVLGSVSRQRGDLNTAKEYCEKSLQHTEGLKYLDGIADALVELAQIEMEMGQEQEACKKYEQAYPLYKALGMDQRANEVERIFMQLQENDNAQNNSYQNNS